MYRPICSCRGFLYGLPTAAKPPAFLWRRSDFPASGELREQDSVCCVYFSALLNKCVCAARARQTFPISALRFEKRGRKSQSSSYYSSLKENEEEEDRGRDGGRKKDRNQVGGYINSYLTVFAILHPRIRSSLSHPFSVGFLHFLAFLGSLNTLQALRINVCVVL